MTLNENETVAILHHLKEAWDYLNKIDLRSSYYANNEDDWKKIARAKSIVKGIADYINEKESD